MIRDAMEIIFIAHLGVYIDGIVARLNHSDFLQSREQYFSIFLEGAKTYPSWETKLKSSDWKQPFSESEKPIEKVLKSLFNCLYVRMYPGKKVGDQSLHGKRGEARFITPPKN